MPVQSKANYAKTLAALLEQETYCASDLRTIDVCMKDLMKICKAQRHANNQRR